MAFRAEDDVRRFLREIGVTFLANILVNQNAVYENVNNLLIRNIELQNRSIKCTSAHPTMFGLSTELNKRDYRPKFSLCSLVEFYELQTKALEKANVELRTNLQLAHENENEQLVINYEIQYKQRIKEYEAQRRKDLQEAELKEACYQSKLDEMARQIEAIKAETSKKVYCPPQPSARKSLGTLRKEVFETVPGTVNVNRGSAVPSTGLSVNWDDNTLPPPSKQVHFGQWSSTPRHTLLHDESDDIISCSVVSASKPIPAPRVNRSIDHTEVAAATLNINSPCHG